MTTDALAHAMFTRQHPDADPAILELAWCDDDVRGFWVAEAEYVVGLLSPR